MILIAALLPQKVYTYIYCILTIAFLALAVSCTGSNQKVTEKQALKNQEAKSWTLGPFVKLYDQNPILTPSPELTFIDPVSCNAVAFEEKNVLNPAAVVKDSMVY